jgi:hypothetical protein
MLRGVVLASSCALRDTKDVAEYCTCGAELPPDALFCHKCGKPQRELTAVEPEAVEEIPVEIPVKIPIAPQVPAPLPEISFHNRMAVRTGLLAAALSSMLISFPMPVYIAAMWLILWLLGGGLFAVFLYSRRTGQTLSVRGGFRLGWITGVFSFVIATVFFTISVITIAGHGGLAAFYKQQLTGKTPPDVNLDQMLSVLESPAGVSVVMVSALILLFLVFTLVPMVGGALGAKVLDRKG